MFGSPDWVLPAKVAAVAELVGRTEQWVQAQAKVGAVPSYRLGGHLRFRMSEVVAWIDAQVTR